MNGIDFGRVDLNIGESFAVLAEFAALFACLNLILAHARNKKKA